MTRARRHGGRRTKHTTQRKFSDHTLISPVVNFSSYFVFFVPLFLRPVTGAAAVLTSKKVVHPFVVHGFSQSPAARLHPQNPRNQEQKKKSKPRTFKILRRATTSTKPTKSRIEEKIQTNPCFRIIALQPAANSRMDVCVSTRNKFSLQTTLRESGKWGPCSTL